MAPTGTRSTSRNIAETLKDTTMLTDIAEKKVFSPGELKKYCARITIDGPEIEGEDAPAVMDCLLASNGYSIIHTYLSKGYPRISFRTGTLPRSGSEDFCSAFSVLDRNKLRLFANIFGYAIFCGNQQVVENLMESMSD